MILDCGPNRILTRPVMCIRIHLGTLIQIPNPDSRGIHTMKEKGSKVSSQEIIFIIAIFPGD